MNFSLTDDMDALVKYSEGNSALNSSEKREGVVVRAFQEVLDLEMAKGFGSGRISFKVVNPQYLLDEE
jgi:hypothetical protein